MHKVHLELEEKQTFNCLLDAVREEEQKKLDQQLRRFSTASIWRNKTIFCCINNNLENISKNAAVLHRRRGREKAKEIKQKIGVVFMMCFSTQRGKDKPRAETENSGEKRKGAPTEKTATEGRSRPIFVLE